MAELLDIIDRDDNIIGTATRDECHSNPELLHHTVHFTFIDRRNKKVLLTQRSYTKKHDAGKYCFLGEHILSGETYEDAVKRGAMEEANIQVTHITEVCQNIFHYQCESELVKFYLCEYEQPTFNFDKEEVEQYMLIDIPNINNTDLDISDMTQYWIDHIDWEGI